MEDKIFKIIQKELPDIQKNILLKDFTTYKIGGPAKYFLIADKEDDLVKATKISKNLKLPLFIFGGGSNLLISDKGFLGLVIKIQNTKIDLLENNFVLVCAGVSSTKLTKFTIDNSLSGIEWFAGIPGTVGGAIYGNAQAFGKKMSDSIEQVTALNTKTFEIQKFSNKECLFSLKNSVFKKNKDLIILSAVLKLNQGQKEVIQEKVKENMSYRKKNHPIDFPSAGSVFVNPEIQIKDEKLIEKFEELKEFNEKGYIHAGYLIEKVGLKGKRIGGAQISEKHANFIINAGGAKAKDVLALIKLAKQKVKKIFNINLETEVQII